MRIVFMGTPDFSVPTLESLVKGGHEVLAVVTQPDKPKGRGKVSAHDPGEGAGPGVRDPGVPAVKGAGAGIYGGFKGTGCRGLCGGGLRPDPS